MDLLLSLIPQLGSVVQWWTDHAVGISLIFAALFHLSEALALIPSVKANSVFQAIFGWLQKNKGPDQK